MTDKLKCPFCESELRTSMLDEPAAWYCPNRCIGTYEPKVWRALITGKKAQHQLRTVKDRCAKTIKAKEREIANYLNGINVRDKEIQNLREQLQKTQDALKVARNLYQELALAYCEMADDYRTTYGCLKTPEQETQVYMQEYDEKITSITKGETKQEK